MSEPKLNKWEQVFWDAWRSTDLGAQSDLTPRYTIDLEVDGESRAREFDFGSPTCRLLIEVDGLGGFDARKRTNRCGGHQTPQGMRADSAKRNAAVLAGWRVLVFPSSRIDSQSRLRQAVEEAAVAVCDARAAN